MKILFMGGHELGKLTLEFLVDKGENIVGVVMPDTDGDWYKGVDEVAKNNNIPFYKENNINRKGFVEKVKDINPDLITVVNFPQILKREIINLPKKGCINTHASLLPKYRGRAPLNWAMINGEDKTGVTVHYIDEEIDTGDIILQKEIEISKDDYIKDLLSKVKNMYPEIVSNAVELIKKDKVELTPQKPSEGFYCGKRTPEDGQINWNKSAEEIYNLIRAVSDPYPGAYSYIDDKKILIWEAELIETNSKQYNKAEPGEIIDKSKEGYIVKTMDSLLEIKNLEFIEKGVEINIGDRFEYKEEK